MNSIYHGKFPDFRPRRLRSNPALRCLVRESGFGVQQLVLPLFVCPGRKIRRPVQAMPGVAQLSPDELVSEAHKAYDLGIKAVLLFGIPSRKDHKGSEGCSSHGIIQKTVRLLKKTIPELLVITDVCLCEYTSHGHCGLIDSTDKTGRVLNDPTLKLLAKMALSHTEAGADIIAPSDMMDGRVKAIRQALDSNGFIDIPIMSYAAKFASAYYGPFREAAQSAPQFGDRRSYQMDPANGDEAMREVAMDIEEGADIVMVKPALAYLDLVYRVKTVFRYPTAAYAVSGEYSMIKAAAERGWVNERGIVMETLQGIRRAGADLIITYWAVDVARWLKEG